MINSLKTAEEFLDLNDVYVIRSDNDVCMINGGNTKYTKIDENEYRTFSSGQNWRDQQSDIRTKEWMIHKIYRNRKLINYDLKQHENYIKMFGPII